MDVIDNVRSAMLAEFEANMRAERFKFQQHLQQVKDEHQKKILELTSKGKIRDAAEQQVRFQRNYYLLLLNLEIDFGKGGGDFAVPTVLFIFSYLQMTKFLVYVGKVHLR
jgi:hypothetical protein